MQTRLMSPLVVATLSVMLLWLLLGCNIALAASGAQRDVSNGKSGKIIFLRRHVPSDNGGSIYEINPDGTGLTHLTGPRFATYYPPTCRPTGRR
jgi:hypothetical protein